MSPERRKGKVCEAKWMRRSASNTRRERGRGERWIGNDGNETVHLDRQKTDSRRFPDTLALLVAGKGCLRVTFVRRIRIFLARRTRSETSESDVARMRPMRGNRDRFTKTCEERPGEERITTNGEERRKGKRAKEEDAHRAMRISAYDTRCCSATAIIIIFVCSINRTHVKTRIILYCTLYSSKFVI